MYLSIFSFCTGNYTLLNGILYISAHNAELGMRPALSGVAFNIELNSSHYATLDCLLIVWPDTIIDELFFGSCTVRFKRRTRKAPDGIPTHVTRTYRLFIATFE